MSENDNYETLQIESVYSTSHWSVSNPGPILHLFTFSDIAGFCAHDPTPIPSKFLGVPVGPDRPRWGQLELEQKPYANQP